jgi:hypothetical protein
MDTACGGSSVATREIDKSPKTHDTSYAVYDLAKQATALKSRLSLLGCIADLRVLENVSS